MTIDDLAVRSGGVDLTGRVTQQANRDLSLSLAMRETDLLAARELRARSAPRPPSGASRRRWRPR